MNKIEAARLAAAAHALRPDWNPQSTLTLLHQIAAWPMRDAAVQLAYLACDPETETPARLLQDGPWRKLTRLVDGGGAVVSTQHPLDIPDADPTDPGSYLRAIREGRYVRADSTSSPEGPELARKALAEAKQARKETVQ